MPASTSIFSEFTNLYSLSKTLRFELKPQGLTFDWMNKRNLIQIDESKKESYKKLKVYFDLFHREFIDKALAYPHLDYDEYWLLYVKRSSFAKKDKEYKDATKEIEKVENRMRKTVVQMFSNEVQMIVTPLASIKDEDKKKGIALIWNSGSALKILKEYYKSNAEISELVDNNFNKFAGYFDKFLVTRANLYSEGAESTAISNRIINENLPKFCKNIIYYQNTKVKDKNINQLLDLTEEEKQIFEINFYNKCFNENGISELYNKTLGYINTKINLYNQQQTDKSHKLKQLQNLYKQILSVKEKFNQDEIEDDFDAIKILNQFVTENKESQILSENIMSKIFDNKLNDLSGISIKHTAINTVSRRWFGSNYVRFEINLLTTKLKKDGSYKLDHFISLESIKKALCEELPKIPESIFSETKKTKKQEIKTDNDKLEAKSLFSQTYSNIIDNNENLWVNFLKIWQHEWTELSSEYNTKLEQVLPLLKQQKLSKNNKIDGELTESNLIKNFADISLKKYQMMKYFSLEEGKKKVEIQNQDANFYNEYDDYYLSDNIVSYYNRFRNYITKKPYSNDSKLKLNFNNPTLLAGWDLNKETTNWSFILRKEGKYYLLISSEGNNQLFEHDKNPKLYDFDKENELYDKMNYKLLSGPNKMLPKCLLPKSDRTKYGATQEILDIYDKGSFKKGDGFIHSDCIKIIDFYKQAIQKYTDWRVFNFIFKPSDQYEDISKFYHDVEKQGFKLNFTKINKALIDEYVEQGYMYQFQIYNKDYKEYAKGSKNLHTLYWESLFSEENLKNVIIKLNGEGEVFLRPIQSNLIKNKRKINGKFKKEITEKNRYLEEKMFLHIPITLNFAKNDEKINPKINQLIQDKPVNIIGIDRGEKHLAYYCVIDQDGNIIDINTLNTVKSKNQPEPIDYQDKLNKKEKIRELARENWESIENIKDLKEGYISQVVNKITDLMLKYNAIVVFEDLNSGFKNSRKRIEKSIYQKLETALASKLGYLVKKSENNVTKAYQLVPKISNYSDIENQKQVGAMLFTTASYTSATCPNCGFRKRRYIKIEGDGKTKLSEIDFNFENDTFILKYTSKSKNDFVINDIIYCKKGNKRIINKKNDLGKWEPESIDIYDKILGWFGGINQITNDLNLQILESEYEQSKYKELAVLFSNLTQLRNSDSSKNIDYISCPSCGYHSDIKIISTRGIDKIQDADANGAYNIARKGLMMIDNIKKSTDLSNLSFSDLYISDENWDKYNTKN